MRILLILTWLVGLLFAQNVRIAAAANMGYALPKIIEAFKVMHPDSSIDVAIGGSGKLRTQIENGAPFDLFLSANTAYPEALFQKGIGVKPPVVYALGELVLFSKDGLNLDEGLSVLVGEKIERIAIANPKTAPYGKAAKEALQKSGLWEHVASKIVYGESISQTVIYTMRMVDVGIIARSALFSGKLKPYMKHATYQPVDADTYEPIAQGMLLLHTPKENPDATALYDFLQTAQARKILQAYGYRIP